MLGILVFLLIYSYLFKEIIIIIISYNYYYIYTNENGNIISNNHLNIDNSNISNINFIINIGS